MNEVKCPKCKEENIEALCQLDGSLIGYRDYGTQWMCLQCGKVFAYEVSDDNE